MVDTKDVSNLLSRAGFTLLTVDTDEVRVGYPSMWELLEDLRDMGESNAIVGRCVASIHACISGSYWNFAGDTSYTGIHWPLPPQFTRVCHCTRIDHAQALTLLNLELHGDEDGSVPATFQIIYMVCSTPRFEAVTSRSILDWLEALPYSAQAARTWISSDEPQGCALSCLVIV